MTLVVVGVPIVVVTAAQARASRMFEESDDDAYIEMLLRAAQQSIDGPHGTLGRAIGEQVLEYAFSGFTQGSGCAIRLPMPDAKCIVSVTFGDGDTIAPDRYGLADGVLSPAHGFYWPAGMIRVRYRAGWDQADVPEPIRIAIIMMAAQLKNIGLVQHGIRSETVDGVGRWDFVLPDAAAAAIRNAADALLQPFKVYRV
ncbi:hypothetical protein [Terrihabitans sp. B22-R8]|uniref:hypothetical protein n=1 Tax=Terrihabitans sp. B22-R8 TaxID=3425128 RepID=UPI00403D387D